MPPSETPLAALQRQLGSGQYEAAIVTADSMIAANRRSFAAWVARARSSLNLGRVMDADRDVDEALRLAPSDAPASLIRAQVDQRLGRIDAAVERLRRLAATPGSIGGEALVLLSEVLHFAHRRADEFRKIRFGWARNRDAMGFGRECAEGCGGEIDAMFDEHDRTEVSSSPCDRFFQGAGDARICQMRAEVVKNSD
jgi:tetratricopeptide (TPR) repeat protein